MKVASGLNMRYNLPQLRTSPSMPEKASSAVATTSSGAPAPTVPNSTRRPAPPMLRKGGRVVKTGYAKVHKGERIIPAKYSETKRAMSSKRGKYKVAKTMHEFKKGTLHSGSKKGPKVRSKKQAIAIALSQARKEG